MEKAWLAFESMPPHCAADTPTKTAVSDSESRGAEDGDGASDAVVVGVWLGVEMTGSGLAVAVSVADAEYVGELGDGSKDGAPDASIEADCVSDCDPDANHVEGDADTLELADRLKAEAVEVRVPEPDEDSNGPAGLETCELDEGGVAAATDALAVVDDEADSDAEGDADTDAEGDAEDESLGCSLDVAEAETLPERVGDDEATAVREDLALRVPVAVLDCVRDRVRDDDSVCDDERVVAPVIEPDAVADGEPDSVALAVALPEDEGERLAEAEAAFDTEGEDDAERDFVPVDVRLIDDDSVRDAEELAV